MKMSKNWPDSSAKRLNWYPLCFFLSHCSLRLIKQKKKLDKSNTNCKRTQIFKHLQTLPLDLFVYLFFSPPCERWFWLMPIMSKMNLINLSTSDQKPRAESLCLLASRFPSFHQTSLCLLPPAFTWLPICLLALAPLVLSLNASLLLLHMFGSPPSITKTLSSVAASTSSLRGKREDGKSAEFTASKQDRDRDPPTPQVNSATLLPLFPTNEQARNVCSLFSGIFMESAQRGKKIKPVPYLTDTLVFTPPPGEGGLLKPCVTRLQETNKY